MLNRPLHALTLTRYAIACAVALFLAGAATAEESIDGYCARLSEKDHSASDGHKLKDPAAIIRQDRANYHAFNARDEDDEDDKSFNSKKARARLETMVKAAKLPADVAETIVSGTPYICVTLYARSVEVKIPAGYPFLGDWTCGGKPYSFSGELYKVGGKETPVQEVQEGSDGSYTLFISDEEIFTLSNFTATSLDWFSPLENRKMECTRN